jgi:hypothetical protein
MDEAGKLMTRLCEIAEKWRTDKTPAVRHNYTPFYDQWLSGREVKKVLEIGIGSVPDMLHVKDYVVGASLFMWEEYFPDAQIYGLDVRPESLINKGRIRSFLCDQGSEESLRSVMPSLGENFDFILDDGSHVPAHQILTAKLFVPLLRPGGLYVIEDVQEPYVNYPDMPYPYTWVNFSKCGHVPSPWMADYGCHEYQIDDQVLVLQAEAKP